MALRKYTKEWLEELCNNSYSYAEVLRKAGRAQGGGAQATLRSKITEYNIDISHFTGQSWNKGQIKDNFTFEELFTKNSKFSRKVIRAYILKHNIFPYKCAMCGNEGKWRGQEIPLELDHINGINNDHRLENLRWLCPNCHATTPTYRRTTIIES